MKITIKNWGPIEEFQYDFSKSMIVTYGDNNIGKSYAMQVVYLFLKHLIRYAENTARYIGSNFTKSSLYKRSDPDTEYF